MIAAALLACAANVAPVTLVAVIEVESRGDPETIALQVSVLGACALASLLVCDRVLAAREREASYR